MRSQATVRRMVITAIATSLSIAAVSVAHAQRPMRPYERGPIYNYVPGPMYDEPNYRAISPQYDPSAPGGNTGGTVNPAINGDHHYHGSNGG